MSGTEHKLDLDILPKQNIEVLDVTRKSAYAELPAIVVLGRILYHCNKLPFPRRDSVEAGDCTTVSWNWLQ